MKRINSLGWIAFAALCAAIIIIIVKFGPLYEEPVTPEEYKEVVVEEAVTEENTANVEVPEQLPFGASKTQRTAASKNTEKDKEDALYTGGLNVPDGYTGSKSEHTKKNVVKPTQKSDQVAKASVGGAEATARQEAAKKKNEEAIAAEKRLAQDKIKKSASYMAEQKKLKTALLKKDVRVVNEISEKMEKELGVETKFVATRPGEKLPESPLTRKKQ